MIHRLFHTLHIDTQTAAEWVQSALVCLGAFGVAGSVWRACVAVVGQ